MRGHNWPAWIAAGSFGALVAAGIVLLMSGGPWYRAPLVTGVEGLRAVQGMAWQEGARMLARSDRRGGMLVLRAGSPPPDGASLLAVEIEADVPAGVSGGVYWRTGAGELRSMALVPGIGNRYRAQFVDGTGPGNAPAEFGLVFRGMETEPVALAGMVYHYDSVAARLDSSLADALAPDGWRLSSINTLSGTRWPGGWSSGALAVLGLLLATGMLVGVQRLRRRPADAAAGLAVLALAWWVLLDASWLRTLGHNAVQARDSYAGLSSAQRLERQYGQLYGLAQAIGKELPADAGRVLLWVDPSQRYAQVVLHYLLLPRNVLATDRPLDATLLQPGDVLVGVGRRPPENWSPAHWQEQLRADGTMALQALSRAPDRQMLRVIAVSPP